MYYDTFPGLAGVIADCVNKAEVKALEEQLAQITRKTPTES